MIQMSVKMKIGFDAKRAFRNNTGLGNYSRFVMEGLLKYFPQNEYFAYSPPTPEGRVWTAKSISLNKLSLRGRGGLLWRSWLIKNDLQRDGIQIYHGLSNELPFGKMPAGIKTVVTIHDLIFERYPKLYPFIDTSIYKIKFRKACQNASAVVAVSEQTKRDIIDFYGINPEKIHVIYQDCDVAFQEELNSEQIEIAKAKYQIKKKYILSVGTIIERKNQLTLVKAFHKLNLNNYDLVLVGGRSPYQNQIESYINEHNLLNVKLLNKIPFQDLPAIYQGSELFAYPSIFEGFGIPIVEALHSGVPVVASLGSCLEEAGGKGALYSNPFDVNDLADKMFQILVNTDLRKQLSEAGQRHIKKFSAEKTAGQLNELYQNL